MGNDLLGWQTSRIDNSKHLSPLSTIGSTTTGHHRTLSLMSLNPLAPAFLPHPQSSSNPPLSLCNSNTINFPLAQLICGMPPQITPSHAPSINQHIADNTLLLPLLQPINQYTNDAAAHKSTPGSSTPLPSSLHHQMKCLQAVNNSIQQFNQHLKAEKLDRQILQLVVLQLQNDFAVLRYLLFSSTGTIPNKDVTAKDAATSPLLDTTANPNPNPNPNPSSHLPSAFSLPGPRAPTLRRLPRWALWEQPEQKRTILQTSILSRHPTRREPLQQHCRTLQQELPNWKSCVPMKYEATHPSLRESIPNISSYMTKFASLNLATQMLLFGRPLSEVCLRLCKGGPTIIRSTHRASYKF